MKINLVSVLYAMNEQREAEAEKKRTNTPTYESLNMLHLLIFGNFVSCVVVYAS